MVILFASVIAHQQAAISAIRGEFAASRRSTLLVLATGLGKTQVFSELARIEATRGVRTLVVAPREELVDQAKATVEAVGLAVGVEQGRRRAGNEPVVVATPQTLRGTWSLHRLRWPRSHRSASSAPRVPALRHRTCADFFGGSEYRVQVDLARSENRWIAIGCSGPLH